MSIYSSIWGTLFYSPSVPRRTAGNRELPISAQLNIEILTNFDNVVNQVNVQTFKLASQPVNFNVRTFNYRTNPSFAAGGGDLVVMKDRNLVSARLRVGFPAGANLNVNYSRSRKVRIICHDVCMMVHSYYVCAIDDTHP